MGKEATRSTEVWTPTPVWPTRRTKCPVAKRPLRLPPASSSLQPPGPLSGSDLPTAGGSGGFRAFKQAPYYGRVTSAKSSGGRDDAWPSPHNGGKCPRSAYDTATSGRSGLCYGSVFHACDPACVEMESHDNHLTTSAHDL